MIAGVALRPLQAEDRDRLLAWRNSPEVAAFMYADHVIAPEEHAGWLQRFLADPDRRGWIITWEGAPVGFLTLSGLAGADRRAEWGWYIGEAGARGRGVGRAAQALGLQIAFEELGLEKVWTEVLADNTAAIRAQTAAGFRREAYLRGHVLKGGRRRDVAVLAIAAAEWRAARAAGASDPR